MLALMMNDPAVQLLGALSGPVGLGPPGDVAPRLRDVLTRGISRRGDARASS